MTRPEWWTDADQAECNCALWHVIDLGYDLTPEQRAPMWELFFEWLYRRRLLSKAEFYRRRHLEAFLGSG